MKIAYTSSDEEIIEDKIKVFVTRPLPWESNKLKKYKEKLDKIAKEKSSKKGIGKKCKRRIDEFSENSRSPPVDLDK